MTYVAILDANVLHPHVAVDLLLRLAERRLFQPAWSEEILEEVHRSLVRRGLDPTRIAHRLDVMRQQFPEAMTAEVGRFLTAVPAAVDRGDHHVVAAALAARADAIVTRNVRDFAPIELIGLGIEVQSMDAFLHNQWSLDADTLTDVLREMEGDERGRRRPWRRSSIRSVRWHRPSLAQWAKRCSGTEVERRDRTARLGSVW